VSIPRDCDVRLKIRMKIGFIDIPYVNPNHVQK
jgi:hypothetical protein